MLGGLGKFSVTATKSGGSQVIKRSAPEIRHKALGSTGFGNQGPVNGGSSMTGSNVNISGTVLRNVVDDFVNPSDLVTIRRIFRDIYYHDSVGGTAVDLLSTLPWSDFTLTGLADTDQLKAYSTTIENLHFKSLFPEISVEYLAMGAFVGILNFSEKDKLFTSIAPQDISLCEVLDMPIYGMDPLINVKIPATQVKLMQQAAKDPRMKGLLDQIPEFMKNAGAKGKIELNPSNALYIPRRTFSTTAIGTSYFRRLLPIYILEKALLRGTIDSAYKRQKGILHVILGDADWEPTAQELSAVANLFVNAGLDPTGAIIATRDGVQTNELSSGESFWKHEDSEPSLTSQKMRALGINDSLFNSDSSYSTLEASLSTFIEQLRTYREMIVRKVFYDKIFPSIAVANDFKKTEREQIQTLGSMKDLDGRYSLLCDGSNSGLAPNIKDLGVDLTEYFMPKVNWHKALKPEADQEYLTVLDTLEQKGVPIALRQWAAAGGVSLTEAMSSLDEDITTRKKVAEWVKRKPQTPAEQIQQMTASLMPGSGLKRVGIGNRKFAPEEIRDNDTGKVLSRKGKLHMKDKVHRNTALALANLAKKENHKNKGEFIRSKTFSFGSSPFGKI
jgi:hypothetical protein